MKTNASGPSPSEQALLELWDFIEAVRLKQSEPHAAIIARRALEAATKETRLNARLKELAIRGGMPLDKVQALVDFTGDELWVESVLAGASATEKAAMLSGTAYKADAAPVDDGGDEYPPELLDALEAAYEQLGDWGAITTALQQLAAPAAPVQARVLTDSGKQSALPTASKGAKPRVMDPFEFAIKHGTWDGR